MSVITIWGNFTIEHGERESSSNTGGRSSHAQYRATIYTETDTYVLALIRTYAPSNSMLHADGTVLFVIGKMVAPTSSGPFFIEAINVFWYPGDPDLTAAGTSS